MSRVPPEATDPATATYQYRVTFAPRGSPRTSDEGEEEVTLITSSTDRDVVRDRARAKLQNQLDLDYAEDVDAEYRIDTLGVGFHDEPWDDRDELETALTSIDGVRGSMYVSPYWGEYGPGHFRLTIEDGMEEHVIDKVTSYYPGLITESGSQRLKVICSPLATLE